MGNNILDFFLFPELILSIGTLIVLLFGLFAKKNIFSITSNLSVILLIIVGVIILADKKVSFANFNNFFIESSFIRFFQILVIIGSISSIVISSNYYKDLKLLRFEIIEKVYLTFVKLVLHHPDYNPLPKTLWI